MPTDAEITTGNMLMDFITEFNVIDYILLFLLVLTFEALLKDSNNTLLDILNLRNNIELRFSSPSC